MSQPTRAEQQAEANKAMNNLLSVGHSIDRKRGVVCIDGDVFEPDVVIDTLSSVVGAERQERIQEVVSGRTFGIATVVEGLANVGNASAVMRTAEAFGFQPFHVITGAVPFKRSSRTTQGADKWLDLCVWETTDECVQSLKNDGYRIVATCLDPGARPIDEIDFVQNTAIVLGNELAGISDRMKELADDLVIVPMPGFVESFNISVAAAISLYHARRERMRAGVGGGDLSPEESRLLYASFLARSTKHAASLLKSGLSR